MATRLALCPNLGVLVPPPGTKTPKFASAGLPRASLGESAQASWASSEWAARRSPVGLGQGICIPTCRPSMRSDIEPPASKAIWRPLCSTPARVRCSVMPRRRGGSICSTASRPRSKSAPAGAVFRCRMSPCTAVARWTSCGDAICLRRRFFRPCSTSPPPPHWTASATPSPRPITAICWISRGSRRSSVVAGPQPNAPQGAEAPSAGVRPHSQRARERVPPPLRTPSHPDPSGQRDGRGVARRCGLGRPPGGGRARRQSGPSHAGAARARPFSRSSAARRGIHGRSLHLGTGHGTGAGRRRGSQTAAWTRVSSRRSRL